MILAKSVKYISSLVCVSAISLIGIFPFRVQATPIHADETISQTETSTLSPTNRSTSILHQINLSSQQKQKIRNILQNRSRQLAYVLTPAQRTKLNNQLDSGVEWGAALSSVNVSATQKKQMLTVIQQTNKEIESVLTLKQLHQVENYFQQRNESDRRDPIY
ncbi:MAG: hypothetical protein JOZ78_14365 [Chroococcidiopsidaceae cyanobacterium CP_BM_ER_R8_30]|nr:hypothetical protein [Chroococcidiopsidaceae cyanobacterium CP_BM_ER_R8_30]